MLIFDLAIAKITSFDKQTGLLKMKWTQSDKISWKYDHFLFLTLE